MSSENYEQGKKDVSVILAIRNEEEYIRKCIDSLIDQSFPHERYEIIIVDGMSNDNTRKIIREYQVKFPDFVRTLDNPKITTATGRNLGIKHAIGKMVVIFSGHACADGEYLNTLIKTFDGLPPDVVGVGGVHHAPEDETLLGKIIAEVQNTLMGGGGTSYKKRDKISYVDTTAFVAYKKEIIEKIGLNDESLPFADDLDLNWRLRKAGFKLMVTPDAKVYYYRKYSSLKLFPPRIYAYALWEAILMKKHPTFFKIPFLIPVVMLLSVILLPVFTFIYFPLAEIILFGFVIYFAAVLTMSSYLVIRHRNIKYLISVLVYVIEHFSFGAGFLVGLFKKIPQ